MDEAITKWLEAIANEELNPEDVERSLRYAKDLEQGLAKIRTFAQGVAIFGSARLPKDSKWCKLAHELGYKLAHNGHPVVTGGRTNNTLILMLPIKWSSIISLLVKLCSR